MDDSAGVPGADAVMTATATATATTTTTLTASSASELASSRPTKITLVIGGGHASANAGVEVAVPPPPLEAPVAHPAVAKALAASDDGVHLTRRRTNSLIRRPRHPDSPTPSPPPSSSSSHAHRPPRQLSLSLSHLPPPTPPPLSSTSTSTSKRHPRSMIPLDEIPFPTEKMAGRVREEDVGDPLLLAICAVLHMNENRALCPKEIAEVMEHRGWLKDAGSTPFAHVSTCIRAHLKRASTASPPYPPLVVPFELSGALASYEQRAVGLRADERPQVKRGTLWFLDERVLGPDCGAEDPFFRCRREAGLKPEDKEGNHGRKAAPELSEALKKAIFATKPPPRSTKPTVLQQPFVPRPPPPPREIVMLEHQFRPPLMEGAVQPGEEEDGDAMGRGKRKRRASSALLQTTESLPPSLSFSTSSLSHSLPSTPFAHPLHHRRSQSFSNSSSSSFLKSSIPKIRLRLSPLEEIDAAVSDSDNDATLHRSADPTRRKRFPHKKIRRAASEGQEDSCDEDDDLDDHYAGMLRPTFSSASSSALLAQSLLAASEAGTTMTSKVVDDEEQGGRVMQPGEMHHRMANPSLGQSIRPSAGPPLVSRTARHPLSISAPIYSSFGRRITMSPEVEVMDVDSSRTADSGSKEELSDEDDFHEAMLKGEEFDFEWGSETYGGSASTSSSQNVSIPNLFSAKKDRAMSTSLEYFGNAADSDDVKADKDDALDEDDDAADGISTPATTPRSPAATMAEEVSEPVAASEPKVQVVPAFKMGMEATLCQALSGEESQDDEEEEIDDELVAVPEESHIDLDRATSTDSLASLVSDDSATDHAIPLSVPPAVTAIPLPSPLALGIHSLPNVFSVDYDFVGSSVSSGPYSDSETMDHLRSRYRAASMEEDDDDDMVTVKIEDGEEPSYLDHHPHSQSPSAPSSRQSSAYPMESFARRMMDNHRLSSSSSSSGSSDSDAFDAVVSSSLLASGLPVPQVAPSPPETSDWGMHLDLDDLDLDLGSGLDLLGPESVGLEELDLAWGGQGDDETIEEWRLRTEGRAKARALASAPTFLTGSQESYLLQQSRANAAAIVSGSSTPSTSTPTSTATSTPSSLSSAPSPAMIEDPVPTPTVTHSATSSRSPSPAKATPPFGGSSVIVYPKIPLVPTVTARIVSDGGQVQRGVAVYATSAMDRDSGESTFLYRRIDTDYINGSVLLLPAFGTSNEKKAVLAEVAQTFSVAGSGKLDIEGTWIPLTAARTLVLRYKSSLSHFAAFLEDELGERFPSPIPEMRLSLRNSLHASASPRTIHLGFPAFVGTSTEGSASTPSTAKPTTATVGKKGPPSTSPKKGKQTARRGSGASASGSSATKLNVASLSLAEHGEEGKAVSQSTRASRRNK